MHKVMIISDMWKIFFICLYISENYYKFVSVKIECSMFIQKSFLCSNKQENKNKIYKQGSKGIRQWLIN